MALLNIPGVSDWIDPRRNSLLGFAAGLTQGNNFGEGLGKAFGGAMQGRQVDDALATRTQEKALQQAQLNKSIEFLRQAGRNDLVSAIDGGMPVADAWRLYLSDPSGVGGTAAAPEYRTVGNQIVAIDPNGGTAQTIWTGQEEAPKPPSGYRSTPGGSLEAIPGGPADPAAKPPRPLSVTAQKELFEAQDAVTAGQYVLNALDTAIAISDQALDGPFANQRATVGAAIPDMGVMNGNATDYPTLQLNNITTELALNQLKTVFGAMPTEGERKILLEMQGSVDLPKAVRKRIYERAKELAQRRIEDNIRKAEAIRSGAYFEEGYSGTTMGAPGTAPNALGGGGQPGAGYTILGVE